MFAQKHCQEQGNQPDFGLGEGDADRKTALGKQGDGAKGRSDLRRTPAMAAGQNPGAMAGQS